MVPLALGAIGSEQVRGTIVHKKYLFKIYFSFFGSKKLFSCLVHVKAMSRQKSGSAQNVQIFSHQHEYILNLSGWTVMPFSLFLINSLIIIICNFIESLRISKPWILGRDKWRSEMQQQLPAQWAVDYDGQGQDRQSIKLLQNK